MTVELRVLVGCSEQALKIQHAFAPERSLELHLLGCFDHLLDQVIMLSGQSHRSEPASGRSV